MITTDDVNIPDLIKFEISSATDVCICIGSSDWVDTEEIDINVSSRIDIDSSDIFRLLKCLAILRSCNIIRSFLSYNAKSIP